MIHDLLSRLRGVLSRPRVHAGDYEETYEGLVAAYQRAHAGGIILVDSCAPGSEAAHAVEGFRFEYGVLPMRRVAADQVHIDLPPPKDPAVHFAAALREKWREVPVTRTGRAFSEHLVQLTDAELLERWESHAAVTTTAEVRGWYRERYAEVFAGKRVLDFGCGFSVDGVFFAERGAHVVFADIVSSNVDVTKRICALKGLDVETYYIDDFFAYDFEAPFDVVMAIGSLIHAPLSFTQRQVRALIPHVAEQGSVVIFGYPKARFDQMGVRNGHEFGMRTDGERTPWAEWLDRDRVERLFGPDFTVVFEKDFGAGGIEFNWFELRRDRQGSSQVPTLA